MKIPPSFQIFATSPDDDEGIQLAKERIFELRLSPDDVKLGRKDGAIVIVTKKEIEL